MDTQMWIVIVAVLVGIIILLGGLLFMQRHRSRHLQERFGPEYERTLRKYGDQKDAEGELLAREQRVTKLHIVPLSAADAARFTEAWRSVQNRFVDDPKGAVQDADRQVLELMQRRGYPTGDFEQRAADLSVAHAAVIDHYRAAHAIIRADQAGRASTEDLRKAIVHYRAIFDELLDARKSETEIHQTEKKGGWQWKTGRDIFRRPI